MSFTGALMMGHGKWRYKVHMRHCNACGHTDRITV